MKELPILFSTPMVQAIQENRKTMTRRTRGLEKVNECPDEWIQARKNDTTFSDPISGEMIICKPRYQIGDHIWVKETWRSNQFSESIIMYKADTAYPEKFKWKSSLFMRKEYTRIWLEVTSVKCERLQNISRGDCCREGIQSLNMSASQLAEQGFKYLDYSKPKQFFSEGLDPFWSFNSLWCSINGGESWELNPWVFVYEFKRIEKP